MVFASSRMLPGPIVALEGLERLQREPHHLAFHFLSELRDEVAREKLDVLRSFAQRGQQELHDVETVEEVLTKVAVLRFFGEVPVRGRDEANIYRYGTSATDALELAILENSQKLGLQCQGKLTDFVEKNGTAVRDLELAFLLLDGTGEGSLFVSEKLAREQVLVESRAIHLDERRVAPGTIEMRVYADSCGLKMAFLGNGGRNAATIFSLRYPSSR